MTNILVVEDNPLNMELVLEILRSLEFSAYGVDNGEEAVKEVDKKKYDVILMDIGLPVMDGVSAAMIIKNKQAYKDVPVIALTAFAMKGDRERFLDTGFDNYIAKPFDVSEFIEKLKKFKKK